MRKHLSLFLVALMSLSLLTGCGRTVATDSEDKDKKQESSVEQGSKETQKSEDVAEQESSEVQATTEATTEAAPESSVEQPQPETAPQVETPVIVEEEDPPMSAWLEGKVKIGDKVYQFPIKVQEFIDDGWTLSDTTSMLDPITGLQLTITKGAYEAVVYVGSETKEQVPVPEGVVKLIIAEPGTDYDITFPGNVTLDTTVEELQATLPAEMEYYDELQWFNYVIMYDDVKQLYVTINQDYEDPNKIYSIEYNYYTHSFNDMFGF